jgi:hypothetical protein
VNRNRHPRHTVRTIVIPTTIAMFAACGPSGGPTGALVSDEQPEVAETAPLALTFEEVAGKYQIPVDLLKSVAFQMTNLEGAAGEKEFDEQPPAFGLFGMRGDELNRAAEMIGRSVDDVIGDESVEIEAVAALLSAYAYEAGLSDVRRFNPDAWAPVLARFGDHDAEMGQIFAYDVLNHLREGRAIPMPDGSTMVIRKYFIDGLQDPIKDEALGDEVAESGSGLGAAGVVWRPSPNYNSRGGASVRMVVIHTCEGVYSGCASWLRNRAASASAHYVVKEDGREVSQLVDERNRAWHVAASYRSWLNGGVMSSLNGASVNTYSIGIEHGGFARQSRWPQSQIDRSVRLVRDITGRHNIPRDRYHVVAHGRLQPETRTDPGPNWPWTSYIAAIRGSTSGGSSGGSSGGTTQNPPAPAPAPSGSAITVDNTTSGRFRASANWAASTWASGKVGGDYRYHRAQEASDLAEYKVNVTRAGRYEVFARVPGNGYNTSIPYIIHHTGGRSIVHRNVSERGGSWVSLGTYSFAAKDDWVVQISVWTTGTGWVIADAIKLEPR